MSAYDAIMCGRVMYVCANVCASACLAMHGIVMHDALRWVIVWKCFAAQMHVMNVCDCVCLLVPVLQYVP